MSPITSKIEVSDSQIEAFCRKWKISEFALFGSILRQDFSPESDVDVLVTFHPDARYGLIDLVHMENELREMFGRDVDLVERATLRNPYRRKEILETAQVVYAA